MPRRPSSFPLKHLKTKTVFTWIRWHFSNFRRIHLRKRWESTSGCLLQILSFQYISHPFSCQVISTIASVRSSLYGHFLIQIWSARRRRYVQCAATHFHTIFVVMDCPHVVWQVSKHLPKSLRKTKLKNSRKMTPSLANRFHLIDRYLDILIAILYLLQATTLGRVSSLGIRCDARRYWDVSVFKSAVQNRKRVKCGIANSGDILLFFCQFVAQWS